MDSKAVQRSAWCRSRRELSNEYLLAKFGVDTAENEPFQVCPLSAYRSHMPEGSVRHGERQASAYLCNAPWHGYLGPGGTQTVKISRFLKLLQMEMAFRKL